MQLRKDFWIRAQVADNLFVSSDELRMDYRVKIPPSNVWWCVTGKHADIRLDDVVVRKPGNFCLVTCDFNLEPWTLREESCWNKRHQLFRLFCRWNVSGRMGMQIDQFESYLGNGFTEQFWFKIEVFSRCHAIPLSPATGGQQRKSQTALRWFKPGYEAYVSGPLYSGNIRQ